MGATDSASNTDSDTSGGPAPIALVTGASRGIGRAIAERLDAEGWQVVSTSRHPDAVDAPPPGQLWELDVSDPGSCARLAERFGPRLDAVVSNAGISALSAAEDTDPAVVAALFATNVIGPMELMRLLLPRLRAAGGRVVTVGSLIADYPVPLQSLYAATKAALRAYTQALREELRGQGVWVTHLEPGDLATEIAPISGTPSEPYLAAHISVTAAREREMAGAAAPGHVAAAVARVLRAHRPPAVVAVGGAAPVLRQIRRLLPDSLAGRLTARRYGL